MRGVMAQSLYPGVVVGIWAPGRGTWVRAFGKARVPRPALRLSNTLRIGSVTKTFTATLVLQLVQEGRLTLDTPLSTFEPWVPNAEAITIEQLLNHTSGLPDSSPSILPALASDPTQHFDVRKLIAEAVAQPSFEQGTFHYSDTGYLLLGLIAEKVSGRSLAEELERRILQPLGLRRTSFAPGQAVPGPAAHGYVYQPQRTDVTHWNASWQWAAGAMVSTLGNLRRWARALAGGALLSPELQRERRRWVPTGLEGISYGLGLAKFGAFLGHDGEVPGYESMMVYSPQLKATVVAIGTTSPDFDILPRGHARVSMMELVGKLTRIAFPRLAKLEHHHVATPLIFRSADG